MSFFIRHLYTGRASAVWAVLLVVILNGFSIPASATTTTTATFSVTATVLSSCLVAATSLAFGTYTATTATPTNASSLITVTCAYGVPYTVAIGAGSGISATVAARSMTYSSTNSLKYNLYSDSGHTMAWGDGTLSTSTQTGTAGLLPTVYTLYGQIPAGQYVPPGSYSDSVIVSLSY